MRGIAEKCFRRGREGADLPVPVDGDHRFRHGLQDRAQLGSAGAEHFRMPLALAGIHHDADHRNVPCRFAPVDVDSALHDVGHVRPDRAEAEGVASRLPVLGRGGRQECRVERGGEVADPVRHAALEGAGFDPEQAFRMAVEDEGIGFAGPFEDAQLMQVHRQRKAGIAGQHGILGLLAGGDVGHRQDHHCRQVRAGLHGLAPQQDLQRRAVRVEGVDFALLPLAA